MATIELTLYILLVSFMIPSECQNHHHHNNVAVDRMMRRQTDGSPSFEQSALSTNQQRPTQFLSPNQPDRPPPQLTHSRGALIMPPNNQFQGYNNFHIFNQQQSLRQPPPFLAANIETSTEQNALRQQQQQHQFFTERKNSSNNNPAEVTVLDHHPDKTKSFLPDNIELALRQASGDENVFQPSPTIGNHELNFDSWLSTQQQLAAGTTTTPAYIENVFTNHHAPTSTPSVAAAATTTTTTEHSNNIAQQNEILLQASSSSSELNLGNNFSNPTTTTTAANQTSANNNVELNNHVIYEGPATAASPSGDYYFSSSEKLPNYEKASNAWWALGIGSDFELASNLTSSDYLEFCSNSELLVNNKQRSLCKSHPKVMPIIARGIRLAIDECQARFSKNRWNCSLAIQNSLLSTTQSQESSSSSQPNNHHQDPSSSSSIKPQVFGEVMKHPNRERSFLNAIMAAGLAHAMTKACSQGELPEECSCDKRIRSKHSSSKGKIEWVACSDDIDYGAKFSRDFTDNTDSDDSDTTSMINTHNYEVGRRIFKLATDITCTCQTELCQTKRCWKRLGPFTDIGDELMKRYESATHVQLSSKDPHKLRPVKRGVRKPKRKDLVYIDESPDYCSPDSRLGVLGTQNRHCNSTSSGPDSCSLLCCGRGYQIVVEEIEEDCNCKFVWCCQVKCDKCKKHVTNDVCN